MKKGLLIAVEGIDGTGKSTQILLLADYLRQKGCEVVVTREPTDGPWGRRIRELYRDRSSCTPEEELEMFINDRQDHVREVIEPALASGKIVLTDRYYFSTAAYQGAAGMDVDHIFACNRFAPQPDLVILLTMDPGTSVRRIAEVRGDKPNDFEQVDQLRQVAEIFDSFRHSCIHRVPADGAVSLVQEQIRKQVDTLLREKKYPCGH
ncbi:dTMP kinase [Desulfolithobacter sp.]